MLLYDLIVQFFIGVINIFFRETTSRGGYRVPKKGIVPLLKQGPVIFVVAPHANQFVDPFILLKHCSRRVGFLVAKSTYDRKYVGIFPKAMGAIPVAR
jgi:glycerol-3-phosphate O-acyltransferase/dihydroxyacetone phosphate acyltransferase